MKNTCVLSCLAPEPSGQEMRLTILELALLLLFFVVLTFHFCFLHTPLLTALCAGCPCGVVQLVLQGHYQQACWTWFSELKCGFRGQS